MSTRKNTPSKPLTERAAAGKSNADGLINDANGKAGADQNTGTQPNVDFPNTGDGENLGTHGNGPGPAAGSINPPAGSLDIDDDDDFFKEPEFNMDGPEATEFINRVAHRIADVLTERGLTTQTGVLSSTVAETLPGLRVEENITSDEHAANVAKFGEGYIKAQKGEAKQIFTAQAWDLLGKDKGGWKRAVEVPAEVQELNKGR